MIFSSKIAGIPCEISVTSYTEFCSATWEFPAEGGEFEYEVLDRRGRAAPWLAKKITEQIDEEIREQFLSIQAEENVTNKADYLRSLRDDASYFVGY